MTKSAKPHRFPKLHNATWPGVVGKGVGDAEPCLDLVTMLDLTKNAEVDGVKFDGFDLFLAPPHFDLANREAEIDKIEKYCADYGFEVGSFVANVWSGSTIGDEFTGTFLKSKRFRTVSSTTISPSRTR